MSQRRFFINTSDYNKLKNMTNKELKYVVGGIFYKAKGDLKLINNYDWVVVPSELVPPIKTLEKIIADNDKEDK